ncbi:MAG TPA: S41 family peptidase [Flavitalea sp.]|nr:S41 family peptidase [Flavitalea sp.]
MKKLQAWLPLLFAIVLALGMAAGYTLRENIPSGQGFFQSSRQSSVQETIDLIRMQYVDSLDMDTLAEDAIKAMLNNLDPHSIFIPAKYLQQVNEDLQGNFDGIGVEFQIIDDTVHVVNVLPGGPSDKAGISTGDRFLSVGDSSVAGNNISSEKIKSLLRGKGGSLANIVMLRNGEKKEFQIARSAIPLYSVDAAYMADSITGFIHLNKFSGTSYEECMQAMEKLQARGMKKLILDLRNNGGGILDEAVDIADEFLDGDKLIVYTQGSKLPKVEYRCKRPGLFEKGELVVLVDEGSASASEVLAGALQDWDRATIIGRRTFGKGLVQKQYSLAGGSALRLTVARYYTPTGRSIQKSYANGRSAYNNETLERFHNGEVLHENDELLPVGDSAVFITKGGRKLYGGGGITPDIYVSYDSSGISANMAPLFTDQHFGKFIYLHYLQRRPYFDQFRDASDFSENFQAGEESWSALMRYTEKNKIPFGPFSTHDREEIGKKIKAWMARQIWGMQGYYEINNLHDKTFQKAMEQQR